MNNRFFKKDDKCIDKLIFELEPNFWWSRRYEYPFALNFIEKTDVVLDACCGTYHPFKFALVEKAKQVFALDLEAPNNTKSCEFDSLRQVINNQFGENAQNKLSIHQMLDIKYKQGDMQNTGYEDRKFDKIFCISALEHMELDVIENVLLEMKRILKDDGKIILTVDYPTLEPVKLMTLVRKVGLKGYGECDYKLPENAIESTYFGGKLHCYSMILVK